MMLNSANLPVLHDYAEARRWYESTVPYRSGSLKGQRPLGNRRYKSCLIRKNDNDSIALALYDSSVVFITPDDTFHISLCRYDTVSTRQFIYATTPFDVTHNRGTTYLKVDGGWYQFKDSDATLSIKDNKVLNPVPETTYKLNRAAMKDVQKKYGAFREYVSTMGCVMSGIEDKEVVALAEKRGYKLQRLRLPVPGAWWPADGQDPKIRRQIFFEEIEEAQVSGNLDKFYALFVELGVSCLHFNGYLKSFIPRIGNNVAKPMLEFFDEMLKYLHKEEIFVPVELPLGKVSSNVNRKYFK